MLLFCHGVALGQRRPRIQQGSDIPGFKLSRPRTLLTSSQCLAQYVPEGVASIPAGGEGIVSRGGAGGVGGDLVEQPVTLITHRAEIVK